MNGFFDFCCLYRLEHFHVLYNFWDAKLLLRKQFTLLFSFYSYTVDVFNPSTAVTLCVDYCLLFYLSFKYIIISLGKLMFGWVGSPFFVIICVCMCIMFIYINQNDLLKVCYNPCYLWFVNNIVKFVITFLQFVPLVANRRQCVSLTVYIVPVISPFINNVIRCFMLE